MSISNPQRRSKRALFAGIVAFALTTPTIGLGLVAPAFADDTTPDSIVAEETLSTDTTDEVVEGEMAAIEETPVVTEEVVLEETPVVTEEMSTSTLRVQPVAQIATTPLGVFGELLPWSAPTNQPSYWEDYGPHDNAQCYSHSGNSDHGSITDGGKTVTLNAFNVAAWPGDHWELLVVKGGSDWNNVIVHPTAGVAYGSPLNSGGQQSDVSHWIVCKGDAPFDWNWEYAAPTCTALTVVYPEDIPSGQANDVNVRIENLLTNQELTLNFHKGSGTWSGTQVFDFTSHPNWPNWPNYKVEWVQVAGTNYHWEGTVTCGTPPPPCIADFDPATGYVNPDEVGKEPTQVEEGLEFGKGDLIHFPAGLISAVGLHDLAYTIVSSTGPSPAYKMEVFANGTTGYGTWNWEPSNNGFALNATGTFTNLENGKWWSSKIPSGPGSISQPIPYVDLVAIYGGATKIISFGTGIGSTTESTAVVSSQTFLCGTGDFTKPPTEFEPASPTKVDVCGVANDSFTLPGAQPNELESITPEGTYTADDLPDVDGTVAVTFVPADGYVVKDDPNADYEVDQDGNAVWIFVFTDEACPVAVTPDGPTKTDVCGVADDTFTLPGAQPGETESVTAEGTYTAVGDPTKGEDVVVTFTPNSGHTVEPSTDDSYEVVGGNAVWTLTYTNVSCPTTVTPVNPSATQQQCVAGSTPSVKPASYTIPSTTGVAYFKVVNGVDTPIKAGTYTPSANETVTITAKPIDDTFVLSDPEWSWSASFASVICIGELAMTGADIGLVVAIILGVIVVGALLIREGRRRRLA